ncbi:T9SS type A sorting domain-containing protein [Candidatus Kryptobacter tengchongensis]|uniref:Por secretion system C-terminal sorting domain-containing protein n=1 Tax=Kryptobacter tengchongensis TaxID=1643429 RepID=A0A656D874_KRYT1|nr:T9SS type A sorting domain-containing protein [Candidatus Kryptobacter tengchongensis]CUT00974.1 Por secretion system C-terminal sorting domain-containing protein [Candidatus Kryptobacter tengchongensis]
MKKHLNKISWICRILMVLAIFISSILFAQPPANVVVLQGRIARDSTLTADKQYLLRGFVTVERGATLRIEPGTVIYGEKETKGTLIIKRGGKIYANGTKDKPIVFTSAQAPGQRSAGDWGGVIILGEAPINVPGGTAVIEGGLGDDGIYGGNNPDDSSGVFRYVRIEFTGIPYQPDNEINGLTLGGVGRKTLIEYVQVSYSGDDAFEWFGGNVNAKYLISYKTLDDDFDSDFGWSGKVQFALALRDPNIADISGSNGFESDNDGTGTTNTPRTSPILSNVTLIGPMPDTTFTGYNPNYKRGAHIRRSSRLSFYNSVVLGWPVGIYLDGSNVVNDAQNDTLQIRNVILAGIKSANQVTTNVSGFNAKDWFLRSQYNNRIYSTVNEIKLSDPFNLSNPKPIPLSDSPLIGIADFTNQRLQDPFFAKVNWVGAFGPDSTQRWDLGWTNYDPQNTDYSRFVKVYDKVSETPSKFELKQNYPNPFNPETTIEFALPRSSNVTLIVYNSLGQEVAKLINEHLSAGSYKVKFDGGNLPSGVYFYKLTTDDQSSVKKMILIK